MNEPKAEIIKTTLEGLMRLEFYKDKGYVVTIQVDSGKYFFIELDTLNEIMQDFNEIVRLKGKKKK